MDAWLLKYERHLSAKTVQAAATQKGKLQWLFVHKQFVALLSRFGTNTNERWHACLKRLCAHAAYVRPDYLEPLIAWAAYMFNSACKEAVKELKWFANASTPDRALWEPFAHLPLLSNATGCPFLLVATPSCREFTQADLDRMQSIL
jgi:hypothetical protein